MSRSRVTIVGAGIGGLACALELAARGLEVSVLERATAPGGKMREVRVGDARIDSGPTVFTMRWVFDQLFAAAGTSLPEHLHLRPMSVLARHAWTAEERLDLYTDVERTVEAIGEFSGAAEARRYREFSAASQRVYQTLEGPFMRSARPGPVALVRKLGPGGLPDLWSTKPFKTLWRALGSHFKDPRLRQLFGRYATYLGSSPFQAPATLMLIAHAERAGVWLVEGGMHRLARVLSELAEARGTTMRYGAEVTEVLTRHGRVDGVRLASGERLATDAVVLNADVGALGAGSFGNEVKNATPAVPPQARSLSAVTWSMVAPTRGFPLLHHTVFFSADYAAEFRDIFRRARLPSAPTVYVCAQDRDAQGTLPRGGAERLLCLVNAPPAGDSRAFDASETTPCELATFSLLERCGLHIERSPTRTVLTTPKDFERLFPATGGALYGRASHGWTASFARPGSRTRIPGLYVAGGSVHPGAGVPMAALSGRLAAASVLTDYGHG